MTLCGQIVDFMRLHFLHGAQQAGAVGHIAIVQMQPRIFFVGIQVQVVDALGIDQRCASLDAVHFVVSFRAGSARSPWRGETQPDKPRPAR